jgi:hypothetical protein
MLQSRSKLEGYESDDEPAGEGIDSKMSCFEKGTMTLAASCWIILARLTD